jgi:uncharacterized membrane protein
MLVLSYVWLLALIPLLVEKNDREVQWHAKHGLVLLAAEFVAFIALAIVGAILDAIVGGLGCLTSILSLLLWLGVLVLHVVCIVKAVGGKRLIIPGLSQYADRF